MRAALVVKRVTGDLDANLAAIAAAAQTAADCGAELVLLPEAAVTGFCITGDPDHDLPLGQAIPGPATVQLAEVARRHDLYIATGLLESADEALYDSAVLLSPDGATALHYRRMQSKWHPKDADPRVYRQGETLPVADTRLGRFVIVICGDLFDDQVVARVPAVQPDWLLVPMARCFGDETQDQGSWNKEGMPLYLEQIRRAACAALVVNQLADDALGGGFGGAFAASAKGEAIASLPLGCEGILLVELSDSLR